MGLSGRGVPLSPAPPLDCATPQVQPKSQISLSKCDFGCISVDSSVTLVTYRSGGVHFRWVNDTFYNKHDIEVEAKVLDRPATQQNEEAPVKGGWRELYKFTYDDANFPNAKEGDPHRLTYEIPDHDQIKKLANQDKHPVRLWMVFQRGGVCGAIAKTFENLNGMAGISSMLHGMPGHAATLKYTLKESKATGKTEPFWVIQNNVTFDEGAGWQRPCSAVRMPRRPSSIWRDPPRKCAS